MINDSGKSLLSRGRSSFKREDNRSHTLKNESPKSPLVIKANAKILLVLLHESAWAMLVQSNLLVLSRSDFI
jgi:hypothetical protein